MKRPVLSCLTRLLLGSMIVASGLTLSGCADDPAAGDGASDPANAPPTGTVFDDGSEAGNGERGRTGTDPSGQDGGDRVDPGTSPGTPTATGPAVWVDPMEHTFSYISPLTEPLTRQFNIGNTGDAELQITGLNFAPGSSQDFSMVLIPPLPKTLLPGKSTMVYVRFQEIVGGDGVLRVETTDPNHPVVEIQLGSYLKATTDVPAPCVGLNPSQLSFGEVERGDTKTMNTVLTNCSETQPLQLTKVTRSSGFFFQLTDEFQVDNLPALPTTLAPGQDLPLTVSYSPKLAGPDSGYFIFHTDDPAEPKTNLDVSALGVAPPPEEVGLTIKLTWDSDLCDVDSHLVAPGGALFDCDSDCFYSNPSPDWGVAQSWADDPFLDVDDVDGFGPENINITEPQPGTYRFVVHYFSDTYDGGFGGGGASTSTNATVELQSYGATVATFGPVFLDATNRTWDVFEVEWPSMAVTTLGSTWMISSSQMNVCGDWPW